MHRSSWRAIRRSSAIPAVGRWRLCGRLVVRALSPHLADLRRRDDAILQGLTDVERSVAELEERVEASEYEPIDPSSMGRVS